MSAFNDPIDVVGNAQLAQLAALWRERPLLALDTEFVRETTFYPIPGLIQLGDGSNQYLIDPHEIDDWTPLAALFDAPGQAKVLHSCSEDLELCNRLLGTAPAPLYDTQIGAALAGWGFSLSYQALVLRCLGIEVEKEHTRSDWVRRPLSAAQRHYAALDVAYLPAVFDQLHERLESLGRLAWWIEEGARAVAASREQILPSAYYLKLSAGWRLRDAQLALLQQLCVWREEQARLRDVPRGRLFKDAQCVEIARLLPRNLSELAAVPELLPQQVRRDGATVLEFAEQARAVPATAWPAQIAPPLPREFGDRLKRLRALAAERATALDLPVELLVRKRDCEALLRTPALPPGLHGWRQAVVGDDLVALARSFV